MLTEKYSVVGKLLRPGEQPTNYSDEDDDVSTERPQTEESEQKPGEENLRKRVTDVTAEGAEEPNPSEAGTDK